MKFAGAEANRVGDVKLLLTPVRTVAVISTAQGMIHHGGLQYLFECDFPHEPPYSIFVDAYHEIGAQDEANALAAAVKLFPFAEPHKFLLPPPSDLRFHWVVARLAELDEEEMTERVCDAWAMVVPKSVSAPYRE